MQLENLIDIEWIAHLLLKDKIKTGPQIKILDKSSYTFSDKLILDTNTDLLVMQGSFDPPTVAHLELMKKVLDLITILEGKKKYRILILLSLAHVQKKFEVTKSCLFGYRFDMLELLFSKENMPHNISFGLSNEARYVDLMDAFPKKLLNSITFIVGTDVFQKVLDQAFYSVPLENLYEKIFAVNYYVIGRNKLVNPDQFTNWLSSIIGSNSMIQNHIRFIEIPSKFQKISSTKIRAKIKNGEVPRDIELSPMVRRYIFSNSLYSTDLNWITLQTVIYESINTIIKDNGTIDEAKSFISLFLEDRVAIQEIQTLNNTKLQEEFIIKRWKEFKR